MKVIWPIQHHNGKSPQRDQSTVTTFLFGISAFSLSLNKRNSEATFFFYIFRLQKIVKDVNRQLQSQGSGPWPANRVASLERSLGELSRILESKVTTKNLLGNWS